jgi:hypothetical protein
MAFKGCKPRQNFQQFSALTALGVPFLAFYCCKAQDQPLAKG